MKCLIFAAPLWGAILNSAASLWFDVCVVEHSGLPSVFLNKSHWDFVFTSVDSNVFVCFFRSLVCFLNS